MCSYSITSHQHEKGCFESDERCERWKLTSSSLSLWIRGTKWSLSTSQANGGCQPWTTTQTHNDTRRSSQHTAQASIWSHFSWLLCLCVDTSHYKVSWFLLYKNENMIIIFQSTEPHFRRFVIMDSCWILDWSLAEKQGLLIMKEHSEPLQHRDTSQYLDQDWEQPVTQVQTQVLVWSRWPTSPTSSQNGQMEDSPQSQHGGRHPATRLTGDQRVTNFNRRSH